MTIHRDLHNMMWLIKGHHRCHHLQHKLRYSFQILRTEDSEYGGRDQVETS